MEYADDIDGSDLPPPVEHQRRSPTMSRNHDSARSTSYAKQDSGFITNSSLSRDGSPTRDSLMRKAQSHSPTSTMGKYVLDRYKSPAIESMRNHALISTFEDMEMEKLMLKDENSDMKEKVYQFQSSMRQLEVSRVRDAERFDLQEREVTALRLQLKAEKDGRQAVTSLAEELQSDLTRKSDLLTIANEELIETRERLRLLDKQLHEEGNNRSNIERTAREVRERLEDVNTELEMEKKMRKVALENIRDIKDQMTNVENEANMFMEAIKDVSRVFESSNANSSGVTLRLPNREAEEKLYRLLKIREDLNDKVATLQNDVATKAAQASDFSDEILNIARIIRSEVKDEVVSTTLLGDIIFREQRVAIGNARVSAAIEPLQASIIQFLEHEMKKRKVLKEDIEACLKKFNWRGSGLNDTQIAQLLNSILVSWSNYRDYGAKIYTRLAATRKRVVGLSKGAAESVTAVRTAMAGFKNTALLPSRHRLDEELYRFTDATKNKYEAARRFLEVSHQTRMTSETSKVRTEQEAKLTEAVNNERRRIQQLEAELTSISAALQSKDEYSLKLINEVRDAESKLFRLMEETKQIQKDHSMTLASVGQQQTAAENALQVKMQVMQNTLENEIEKLKRDLDHRAKTIAALDETIVAKDQRVAAVQAKLKERTKKQEAAEKELAAEKDPSKQFKLTAAIKTYEREVADLRAKITEKDTLITHLKKRVDEALNRGQKKMNEATERTRAELIAKEAKFTEKEKEVEKLQDQLTRLSRVVSKGTIPAKMIPAGADSSRSTIYSATPTVRTMTNVRSVSGSDTSRSRLPPIVPAGTVGGDPSSNANQTNGSVRSSQRGPNSNQSSYAINRSVERLAYQSTQSRDALMAKQEQERREREPDLPPWRPPNGH